MMVIAEDTTGARDLVVLRAVLGDTEVGFGVAVRARESSHISNY